MCLSTHHHVLYGIRGNLLDSQPVQTLLLIFLARSLAPPLFPSPHMGAAPWNQVKVLQPVVNSDAILVYDLPLWGDATTVALPGGQQWYVAFKYIWGLQDTRGNLSNKIHRVFPRVLKLTMFQLLFVQTTGDKFYVQFCLFSLNKKTTNMGRGCHRKSYYFSHSNWARSTMDGSMNPPQWFYDCWLPLLNYILLSTLIFPNKSSTNTKQNSKSPGTINMLIQILKLFFSAMF